MNLADKKRQTRDDMRLLDRLVDGELPDVERRELLLWLEKEPDGWRRCALAFLEAQTWRQALAPVAAPQCVARPESANTREETPFEDSGRATRSRFWRPVARLTGLAAGLAVAFALGWDYHSRLEKTVPFADVNRQAGAVAGGSIPAHQEDAAKVAKEYSRPTKPAEASSSIDPIVKNLQQRGYSVETQQRMVLMESKDGRKVKLPVQEVRIRYSGDRIY